MDVTTREVRDLPCFEYRSKRYEEAVGEACESASARRISVQAKVVAALP